MILSQELLRSEAARRVTVARPDLAARHDLSTTAGLLAFEAGLTGAPDDEDAVAVVVVRDLDLPRWAADTCAFAAGLREDQALAWRRSFTRTVFLAGNPGNLRDRVPFARLAPDGSVGWLAPAPERHHRGARRLLRRFDGAAGLPARPPTTVVIPGTAPSGRPQQHRVLYVPTAGMTTARCLIHLNHLLAEAVQDGLLAPGDRLTLVQVPCLTGLHHTIDAVRVGPDAVHPETLRAYACLTKETTR